MNARSALPNVATCAMCASTMLGRLGDRHNVGRHWLIGWAFGHVNVSGSVGSGYRFVTMQILYECQVSVARRGSVHDVRVHHGCLQALGRLGDGHNLGQHRLIACACGHVNVSDSVGSGSRFVMKQFLMNAKSASPSVAACTMYAFTMAACRRLVALEMGTIWASIGSLPVPAGMSTSVILWDLGLGL